jgi:hypothetical protein
VIREVWVYKAKIEELTNKLNQSEDELIKEKRRFTESEGLLKAKQDRISKL